MPADNLTAVTEDAPITEPLPTTQVDHETWTVAGSHPRFDGDELYEYAHHNQIYYKVPDLFWGLVGIYDYSAWLSDEKPKFDDFHEMAMVQFIKRFNISRKQFDEINAIYEKAHAENALSADEVVRMSFDADIIYTFDNERISEYYRRE
jgi:hypothetical protein